jgi:hypothetical protein
MIEEDAAVALCQWFEVACGAPEFRIAARSEMQNERWALALDLIVESGPVGCCQEGHFRALILATLLGKLPDTIAASVGSLFAQIQGGR